ncbi:MAG: diacylglycerol kinase family lipid kinase [Bacteroidales bacterium]|nr:diacylglycerol kinase family lipid kinase [Bacteroidales bacterium]
MKRITFIVNPVSGGKDKKNVLAAIGRYLDLSQFSYEVLQTVQAGDATRWAREIEADIVVAVGGDGTVSEVATGLLGTGKALGILPCGSGDGLALHLGISRNPAKAVKVLNDACIATIDAAQVNGRPFFCTAGVGLDADVSLDFARSEKRGLTTYITTAWEDWKQRNPNDKYVVETDTEAWAGPAVFITVGNANQWGNEARIVPNASLRDGLLDVTVVLPFATYEIPELAARLMLGKAETSRRVRTFRGKTVRIHRDHPGPAHCDGDPFEAGVDLRMEIKPGALRAVVPRSRLAKI